MRSGRWLFLVRDQLTGAQVGRGSFDSELLARAKGQELAAGQRAGSDVDLRLVADTVNRR